MYKSFGLKLLGALGLSVTLTLAACGGGGGSSGTPLVPPTSRLIMTPNLSEVTMAVGQFVEPVKISGGQAPYYVGSTTSGVIPTLLSDGTLLLQAVAPTATSGSSCSSSSSSDSSSSSGSSDYVWVQDSSYNQTQLEFNVCVNAATGLSGTLGSSPSITLSPGGSQSFTVTGGTPPYTVASSNPSVASVSSNSATGPFTITAGSTLGSTTVTVTDTHGASYTVAVQNAVATPLAVSPTSITGAIGNNLALTVIGGIGPYTAVSSNGSVATVSVSGSLVSVIPVSAGSTVITIRDATGTIVTVPVTVTASTTNPLAVSPTALTGAIGDNLSLSLSGGTGSYTAISSNTNIATVSVNGSLVSVTPVSAGSATITIHDTSGATATAAVTITATGTNLAVSPTSISGVIGNHLMLTVSGGVAPYQAVSSNTNVATVSVNGSQVLVTAVGAGGSGAPASAAIITITDSRGNIVTATVTINPTFAVTPPSQFLTTTQQTVIFSLLNGTGPWYVAVPTSISVGSQTIQTSKLISVSPMLGDSGTTSSVSVTLLPPVTTTCALIPSTGMAIPITVTDVNSAESVTGIVQINAGCTTP